MTYANNFAVKAIVFSVPIKVNREYWWGVRVIHWYRNNNVEIGWKRSRNKKHGPYIV